jgi:hypothetical protein
VQGLSAHKLSEPFHIPVSGPRSGAIIVGLLSIILGDKRHDRESASHPL